MWRRILVAAGAAWMVAGAGGLGGCSCAPDVSIQEGPGARFERFGSSRSLGEWAPPEPQRGATLIYRAWDASSDAVLEMRINGDEPDEWVISLAVSEGGGGEPRPVRDERIRRSEDGSLVLVESINHGEGVEVVFDPPPPVRPAGLAVGVPREWPTRMTVHPLGDRSRVKTGGPATMRVELLGEEGVATDVGGGGGVAAWHLRTTLEADLGPSHVVSVTETWTSPEWGQVAERRQERTTVLGIRVRSNREAWVLERVEGAAGQPPPD